MLTCFPPDSIFHIKRITAVVGGTTRTSWTWWRYLPLMGGSDRHLFHNSQHPVLRITFGNLSLVANKLSPGIESLSTITFARKIALSKPAWCLSSSKRWLMVDGVKQGRLQQQWMTICMVTNQGIYKYLCGGMLDFAAFIVTRIHFPKNRKLHQTSTGIFWTFPSEWLSQILER